MLEKAAMQSFIHLLLIHSKECISKEKAKEVQKKAAAQKAKIFNWVLSKRKCTDFVQ